MSKRPKQEQIELLRKQRNEAAGKLRKKQQAQGLRAPVKVAIANHMSQYASVQEEQDARQKATVEQMQVFRAQLPVLLKRLSKIEDPRNPKKTKHKLTMLLIYGILTFVLQMSSRREANREMTRPQFKENLKLLFPELDDLPHSDTLERLLSRIEVSDIESAHISLVRKLIRNKKFARYLVDSRYPIAIDGTQKAVRNLLWSEQWLEREIKSGDDSQKQHYVLVLEASLAFSNGMTIPLMSEFSDYAKGDTGTEKQDCEQKAFKRLAKRLKAQFSHLPIMVLLDGLYPNGPMMALCRKYKWDFMMVLQDKSLKSVWEEYNGLKQLEVNNTHRMRWGDRRQRFEWVNGIEYYYDSKAFKKQVVHLVVCEESWTMHSRHAWISSQPLNKENVHQRCNLAARHRWGIESGFLVEKRQGYQYEHLFSYNWNAMKGYHYLMRLGHLINILAHNCESLVGMVHEFGVRGFVRFICGTLSGPWLDPLWVRKRLAVPFQLRLI
jgi:hypothetical protein